ncbi:MAG: radical SAM protein [Candidatus Kaelpia imicola]|nr:radical SAM protein [Candidatus Kaelpia imicola]
MEEIQYRDFSLKLHQKKWQKKNPVVAQFELTFGCNMHCRHCYSNCYNNSEYLKRELNTKEVIDILDKLYKEGIFWLCFTGGDPLKREDFIEIYSYAKKKGFIITVFTNAALIDKKIADYFKRFPPFCIEITLNAVTEKIYEEISQVKGSFKLALNGIENLIKRDISLKIKTQATKQNYQELDAIKEFIEKRGLKFRVSAILNACLNGDLTPVTLRLSPKKVLEINERFRLNSMQEDEMPNIKFSTDVANQPPSDNLFRCAIGLDTFHITPTGEMILCTLVREPSINLLDTTASIQESHNRLLSEIRNKKFKTNSKCKTCLYWYLCSWCPGRAKLEIADEEAPLSYFCKLTHLVVDLERERVDK